MNISIFVSHSFDHPDKLLRIQEFMLARRVRHVDYSVPVWDQLNDDTVQFEIEQRIQACDRVIVILTEGSHKSRWIKQEVDWARDYGKPVIGVWPHGEAGAPVPRAVVEANAHLIGWRATSLEKALKLQDVGDYRALALAEDVDFDRAVERVVTASGAISLLLVGYQVVQLSRLVAALRKRGIDVALGDDWRRFGSNMLIGASVGALAGFAVDSFITRTSNQTVPLVLMGAGVGAALGAHRYLRAEVRSLEALTIVKFEKIGETENLGPGC